MISMLLTELEMRLLNRSVTKTLSIFQIVLLLYFVVNKYETVQKVSSHDTVCGRVYIKMILAQRSQLLQSQYLLGWRV